MTELPAPLTPPGCDLRRLPFMPWYLRRAWDSHSWMRFKRRPELFFPAFNLIGVSWFQVPAASLPPGDDDWLCDKSMCPPDRWDMLKPDILKGWVLCSDGRLYHPVVAELALAALAGKLEADEERAAEARARTERRRRAREALGGDDPPAGGAVTESGGQSHFAAGQGPPVRRHDDFAGRRLPHGSVSEGKSREVHPPSPPTVSGGPEEARQGLRGDYPPAFEALWRAYPTVRGNAKDKAFSVWQRLGNHLPPLDVLLACVRGYAAFIDGENRQRPASEPYRIAFTANWLRDFRWKDFERAAVAEMAREAEAVARREAAIPAGAWSSIAARFAAAHSWTLWDAAVAGVRLIDGDLPGLEYRDDRARRFAEEHGLISKLQAVAGGGLLISVRVRAAS